MLPRLYRMKTIYFSIAAALWLGFGCNSAHRQDEDNIPMKVADAYGFDEFATVSSLRYTWNVRVDSATVRSRSWEWNPKTGEVGYSGTDTSLVYFESKKDSTLDEIDGRFINDKYWLLFPFQLAWDTGYEYEVSTDETAPISGAEATKLTVVYNQEDGYTPGDAYDLYLDEEYKIMEWVFRRGNGTTGRPMTWETVKDYNGLKIALEHKDDKGNLVLWFSDVTIEGD